MGTQIGPKALELVARSMQDLDERDRQREAELRMTQRSLFEVAPWGDNMRALPNDLARAALFTVRNKKQPRVVRQNYPIFTADKNVEIHYTGIELRAEDDELVWQQVLEYVKREPLGTDVYFTKFKLCADLGWPANGRYYQKVEECLTRLKATALTIKTKRLDEVPAISLLRDLEFIHKAKTSAVRVQIDPRIVCLFLGNYYTYFIWQKYRQLSPTARRLYDYFASHRNPRPLPLETFRLMCGSDSHRDKKWREQAKSACDELNTIELVPNSWVNAEDSSIYCDR